MARLLQLNSANDVFQHIEALIGNRTKRLRSREFVVEGVRAINSAIDHGWEFVTVCYSAERRLSTWARGVLADVPSRQHLEMTSDLLARLSDRDDTSELIVTVAMPDDADMLGMIVPHPRLLLVVLDRPSSPGNVGTIIRSAAAWGADAVLVAGHAADPYDPASVRASVGALFAIPVIRVARADDLAAWWNAFPAAGRPQVVAADATGGQPIDSVALHGPVAVVLGNEARGLSAAFRRMCSVSGNVPLRGAPDSLNVACAASAILYEVDRQRRHWERTGRSPTLREMEDG